MVSGEASAGGEAEEQSQSRSGSEAGGSTQAGSGEQPRSWPPSQLVSIATAVAAEIALKVLGAEARWMTTDEVAATAVARGLLPIDSDMTPSDIIRAGISHLNSQSRVQSNDAWHALPEVSAPPPTAKQPPIPCLISPPPSTEDKPQAVATAELPTDASQTAPTAVGASRLYKKASGYLTGTDAALSVLETAEQWLTTGEIAEVAVTLKLLDPSAKAAPSAAIQNGLASLLRQQRIQKDNSAGGYSRYAVPSLPPAPPPAPGEKRKRREASPADSQQALDVLAEAAGLVSPGDAVGVGEHISSGEEQDDDDDDEEEEEEEEESMSDDEYVPAGVPSGRYLTGGQAAMKILKAEKRWMAAAEMAEVATALGLLDPTAATPPTAAIQNALGAMHKRHRVQRYKPLKGRNRYAMLGIPEQSFPDEMAHGTREARQRQRRRRREPSSSADSLSAAALSSTSDEQESDDSDSSPRPSRRYLTGSEAAWKVLEADGRWMTASEIAQVVAALNLLKPDTKASAAAVVGSGLVTLRKQGRIQRVDRARGYSLYAIVGCPPPSESTPTRPHRWRRFGEESNDEASSATSDEDEEGLSKAKGYLTSTEAAYRILKSEKRWMGAGEIGKLAAAKGFLDPDAATGPGASIQNGLGTLRSQGRVQRVDPAKGRAQYAIPGIPTTLLSEQAVSVRSSRRRSNTAGLLAAAEQMGAESSEEKGQSEDSSDDDALEGKSSGFLTGTDAAWKVLKAERKWLGAAEIAQLAVERGFLDPDAVTPPVGAVQNGLVTLQRQQRVQRGKLESGRAQYAVHSVPLSALSEPAQTGLDVVASGRDSGRRRSSSRVASIRRRSLADASDSDEEIEADASSREASQSEDDASAYLTGTMAAWKILKAEKRWMTSADIAQAAEAANMLDPNAVTRPIGAIQNGLITLQRQLRVQRDNPEGARTHYAIAGLRPLTTLPATGDAAGKVSIMASEANTPRGEGKQRPLPASPLSSAPGSAPAVREDPSSKAEPTRSSSTPGQGYLTGEKAAWKILSEEKRWMTSGGIADIATAQGLLDPSAITPPVGAILNGVGTLRRRQRIQRHKFENGRTHYALLGIPVPSPAEQAAGDIMSGDGEKKCVTGDKGEDLMADSPTGDIARTTADERANGAAADVSAEGVSKEGDGEEGVAPSTTARPDFLTGTEAAWKVLSMEKRWMGAAEIGKLASSRGLLDPEAVSRPVVAIQNGLVTLQRRQEVQRETLKGGRAHYAIPGVPLEMLPTQSKEEGAGEQEQSGRQQQGRQLASDEAGVAEHPVASGDAEGQDTWKATEQKAGSLTGTEAAWKILCDEKRWMTSDEIGKLAASRGLLDPGTMTNPHDAVQNGVGTLWTRERIQREQSKSGHALYAAPSVPKSLIADRLGFEGEGDIDEGEDIVKRVGSEAEQAGERSGEGNPVSTPTTGYLTCTEAAWKILRSEKRWMTSMEIGNLATAQGLLDPQSVTGPKGAIQNGLATLKRQQRVLRERPAKGRTHYAAAGVPLPPLPVEAENTEKEGLKGGEEGVAEVEVEAERTRTSPPSMTEQVAGVTESVDAVEGHNSPSPKPEAASPQLPPTTDYLRPSEAAWKILCDEKRWMTPSEMGNLAAARGLLDPSSATGPLGSIQNGLATLIRQERVQRQRPKKGRIHYAAPDVSVSLLPEPERSGGAVSSDAGEEGEDEGEKPPDSAAAEGVEKPGVQASRDANPVAGAASGFLTGMEAAWKVLSDEKRWMTRREIGSLAAAQGLLDPTAVTGPVGAIQNGLATLIKQQRVLRQKPSKGRTHYAVPGIPLPSFLSEAEPGGAEREGDRPRRHFNGGGGRPEAESRQSMEAARRSSAAKSEGVRPMTHFSRSYLSGTEAAFEVLDAEKRWMTSEEIAREASARGLLEPHAATTAAASIQAGVTTLKRHLQVQTIRSQMKHATRYAVHGVPPPSASPQSSEPGDRRHVSPSAERPRKSPRVDASSEREREPSATPSSVDPGQSGSYVGGSDAAWKVLESENRWMAAVEISSLAVERGLLDPTARVTPALKIQNGLTHLHNQNRIERYKPTGGTKILYRAIPPADTPLAQGREGLQVATADDNPAVMQPPVEAMFGSEELRDAQKPKSHSGGEGEDGGSFLSGRDATLKVLLMEKRPLTVGEIAQLAVVRGFLDPNGKSVPSARVQTGLAALQKQHRVDREKPQGSHGRYRIIDSAHGQEGTGQPGPSETEAAGGE